MTFVSALSQIPSEKQIRKKLEKVIFGKKGVWCPGCGKKNRVYVLKTHRLWRCARCRNKFSLTSVTWLKGAKISLQHLWSLIWCWQKKIQVDQAVSLCGLSVPTVRRYYEFFRDHLEPGFEVILEGNVQMDEMFVKGAFVMGAKDVKRKQIHLKVVSEPYPGKRHALEFIQQHVRPGSVLCTDGGGIYKGCEKWWPLEHVHEIHKRFEFEITSEIEGIWGVLRTFIRRMYHHVTFRKFPKVVAEFEARQSHPELFETPLNLLTNLLTPVKLAF